MNNRKVLIIDDDPSTVSLLEVFLKSKGYEVITAHNGELGMKKAKEQEPSLIFLDIVMPGLTGGETAMELKKLHGIQNIPVVFMSAAYSHDDKRNYIEVDGINYRLIAKPLKLDLILDIVKNFLG